MCQQKSEGTSLQGEMASADCPLTKKPARSRFAEAGDLSTISKGSTDFDAKEHNF
jgi:hypothetical protein